MTARSELCRPPGPCLVSIAWWDSLTSFEQAWMIGALTADKERTERILQGFRRMQREFRRDELELEAGSLAWPHANNNPVKPDNSL